MNSTMIINRRETLATAREVSERIRRLRKKQWREEAELSISGYEENLLKELGLGKKRMKRPTVIAYRCDECDTVFPADQVNPSDGLYECTECDFFFSKADSADGSSHMCPECLRFGHKRGIACLYGCEIPLKPLVLATDSD